VAIAAEPPQEEDRAARLDWPNPTPPYLMVGYHVPAFTTAAADTAAVDLLDQLLTAESAPLYRELVIDRQWVDQFGAVAGYQRDPALYILFARVKSAELVPRVEAAIAAAVAELGTRPVDGARLDRIKSHLRYAFALGLDSPAAIGFRAAEFLSLTGGVGAINDLFRRQAEVTPADVERLAREVFRSGNRTAVVLAHPEPAGGEGDGPATGGPAAGGGGGR
jgi:zinc protease